MVRTLLSVVAVLLLATSSAQASPINLLLTVDINNPSFGPPETTLTFRFLQSDTDGWLVPGGVPHTVAFDGGATVMPGVTQLGISLDVTSLDNIYFRSWGFYDTFNAPFESVFVAEPPTGHVDDGTAWARGAPWIPLADLGNGFSGDLHFIAGYPRVPIGTDVGTWALAPAPLTPVPEPASLLLLGSGLAAVAAKRYRQSKNADIQ